MWIATVDNIDWPSRPGLSTWEQQAELIALLNRAVALRMNAVIFQVRPAADAMYQSPLEPWSEYLTGQMGRPPEPYYDPLAFAVAEAHKRGLQLHAWFNPYRARHPSARSPIAATHVSRTRPALVRTYGRHLWLDPGDPAVRDYSLSVIMDVVRRYDIDGVHLDDYFYPYLERNERGNNIPFPDDASYARYRSGGGQLSRADWRRQNVDLFVEAMYNSVKAAKPWVSVGISPFGIWRSGSPPEVQGLDAYTELFADSRKWLANGWLDYLSPQLYWPIDAPQQSYPVLLRWWVAQNAKGRNIWPGIITSRVADGGPKSWRAQEILDQIALTRAQPGASGNIQFSAKALMQDRDSIATKLATGLYASPAMIPASPWLSRAVPPTPFTALRVNPATGASVAELRAGVGGITPWLWIVRARFGDSWTTDVLPGWQESHALTGSGLMPPPDLVSVVAVDRFGTESAPAYARVLPPL